MNLNNLLVAKNIDPREVLVFRHCPFEPELNKVLPWLAAEKPEVFNAYQQTQGDKVEKAMTRAKYIASFIGLKPGTAVFVGLYTVQGSKPMTREEYWEVPAYIEMKKYGMKGMTEEDRRPSILWFDLVLTDTYTCWKGKLIVDWPGPERSWWRRAERNIIPVRAILEDSALNAAMPEWDELVLSWDQFDILPTQWKSKLAEWRGVYYIFDASDGKGYVGSAYGEENLLGRWRCYAASGHGGNKLLRRREAKNFRFSILQRVSPDMDPNDVISLEASWKLRLHTRSPEGLNDN